MGDEAHSVHPTPLKRDRTGDLKRVAEIVMVLSTMGEMRAGKDPTAVEKALAAEARERLAGICETELKPKDMISRDAVRAVVEDLGLNRSRDPMMGFRPMKMSIAQKLMFTKRKMEESKSFAPHSSVYVSQHAPVESLGTSMRQSPMGFSTGGFQSVSPGLHVPTVTSITPSLKQSQVNETQLTTTPLKSSMSSLEKDSPLLAQQRAGAPHVRFDGRLNGPPYLTQVQASSVQSTSAAHVKPIQPNNVADHSHGKFEGAHVQKCDQVARSQGANVSETPAAPANPPIGHQLAGGPMFVQGPSFFTNHEDISKNVQKILQPKVFDHPNWNPPSAEYTNKSLNCQICKVPITDVESLFVCDACEKGTHLKCLQSFNKDGVPKAEWHCPRCLITSNGKSFPPKYGRVTRTIAPQKTPSNIVATSASSDKKPVNVPSKVVNQQRSVANGNVGLPVQAPNSLTNCSESSRDSKTAHTPDIQSGLKHEAEPPTVTSTNNSAEKRGVVCALPSAKTESSDKDIKYSGSLTSDTRRSTFEIQTQIEKETVPSMVSLTNNSTRRSGLVSAPVSAEAESSDNCFTEQVGIVCAPPSAEVDSYDKDIKHSRLTDSSTAQDGICAPSSAEANFFDKDIKISELPTSNLQRSTIVSLDVDVYANQLKEFTSPCTDESKEPAKLQGVSQQNTGCDIRLDDHDNSTVNDSRKPLELKEISEYEANKNLLDYQDKCDATPNGLISNDGTSDCNIPSVVELDAVHWLGDVLQVIEEKTYYQSCQINGVLHKLQNHVLVSSSSQIILPSKLQSLWEDSKTGSKWAIVNQYYSPGELSEVPNLPSTPENNEVYASNKEYTIMASSICGQCEVLPAQKFTEEIDRRRDANSGLHKVFLCRWMYDASKGIFQSISE